MDEYSSFDLVSQAELVRTSRVGLTELTQRAIDRCEELNSVINAVTYSTYEQALKQAKSADSPRQDFAGVPILLKDLDCPAAGDPYTEGMAVLRDRNWTASDDSYMVGKLRSSGFTFVGRTNVPEWGTLPTTEPIAFGPTRNPWNLSRSPGGSSGGSAASVAAGIVAGATGGDFGGSLRIPASACGVVGLKPTRGRVSLGPEHKNDWGGLVSLGVLTRTVRDTAAVLDVVVGHSLGDVQGVPALQRSLLDEAGEDPGRLRIGLLTHVPGDGPSVSPPCARAALECARVLEDLGHVVEMDHPAALTELHRVRKEFGRVVSVLTAWRAEYWGQRLGAPLQADDIEPLNWAVVERGRLRSAVSYLSSQAWLRSWSQRALSWWSDKYDLLLTPTMPEPPFALGEIRSDDEEPFNTLSRVAKIVPFTFPFNVTGQPAISLPWSWTTDDLPIGVQLVGAIGREDLLIRIASQLEIANPWGHQWPPISGRSESSD